MTHTPQDPRYTGEVSGEQAWPPATPDYQAGGQGYDLPATDPGNVAYHDVTTSDVDQTSDHSATKDVARSEASEVKDTAADAGKQVAQSAKDQAQNVAAEVKQQSRQLLQQTFSELGGQVGTQQQRVAELVGGYSAELRSMASNSQESGLITSLANDAAERAEMVSTWLSEREPGDVLEEIRSYARRRPVAFLAIAAVSGFVVGRLTRGLVADARSDSNAGPQRRLESPVETREARSNYLIAEDVAGSEPAYDPVLSGSATTGTDPYYAPGTTSSYVPGDQPR